MTLPNNGRPRSSPPPRMPGRPVGHRPVQALRVALVNPDLTDAAFRFYSVVVLDMPQCVWHTVDDMAARAGRTNYQVRGYLGQLTAANLLLVKRATIKDGNGRRRDVKTYKAVTPR